MVVGERTRLLNGRRNGVLFEDAAGEVSRIVPALTRRRAKGTWEVILRAREHGAPIPQGAIAMHRVERRRVVAAAILSGAVDPGDDFDPDIGVREPRPPRAPRGGAGAEPPGDH